MIRGHTRCFCGSKATRKLFGANPYIIVECQACGQVRTITPASVKRTQYYEKENFSIYLEKEEMFRRIFREKIQFLKKYKQQGALLDIGAGVGLFVDEARIAGFDAIGFEPSKSAVAAAKKYFHVSLINHEFNQRFAKGPYDVVVINHVLEHMTSPNEIINGVSHVLQKKGILVIGLPNFDSILRHIKRGRWQNLIPDQHRWHFTKKTLDQLVLPLGFKSIASQHENHDRSMIISWKRIIYEVIDIVALATGRAEAVLVIYQKI